MPKFSIRLMTVKQINRESQPLNELNIISFTTIDLHENNISLLHQHQRKMLTG